MIPPTDDETPPRAVCLYSRSTSFWVDPVAQSLCRAGRAAGVETFAVSIEDRIRNGADRQTSAVYVLPFDVPGGLPARLDPRPRELVRALFPHAEVVNDVTVHEACHDKIATAQRLIGRGIPMPESLITEDPDEAQAFVRENDATILKEPRSCGGQGHVVLVADDAGTIVGETPGRRYLVELQSGEGERAIDGNVLFLHPPFYVQRLIASVGRDRKLRPAQVLRAYVVDGQVVLWTERYRPRAEHPADFIISIRLGGRYRFLREVSEEAQKIALRAAEVMGVRVGAVDLIRAAPEGPMVLELDTDGPHLHIDRSFMELPEFRAPQDIDRFIGESIAAAARAPRPQPRTRERLRRIPHPKHATARRR